MTEITTHTIEPSATEIVVGETVRFKGYIGFADGIGEGAELCIDIYVNDELVKELPPKYPPAGLKEHWYGFYVEFEEPGVYRVRALAVLTEPTQSSEKWSNEVTIVVSESEELPAEELIPAIPKWVFALVGVAVVGLGIWGISKALKR